MFMCYARIWLLMTSIVLKYRANKARILQRRGSQLSAVASARLKIEKESLKGKTSVMFSIRLIKYLIK